MPDPIVSLAAIQRQAEEAAAAGCCPHAACLWPPESAAALAFHQQFDAQQALQGAACGHKDQPHDLA